MRISIKPLIGFLLLLATASLSFAGPGSPQKYAPVVGRWRIELNIEGSKQLLDFQTDGHGVYGLGTGFFFPSREGEPSQQCPAAWSNIDPQKINLTGEIKFVGNEKFKSGTLILRNILKPGEDIKGDALFIDEKLTIHRGTFTMKMLLGPEQILEKRGTDK